MHTPLERWAEQKFCSLPCWINYSRTRDRKCTLCKRTLPAERFGFRSIASLRRKSRCRDCARVWFRAAYKIGKYRHKLKPRQKERAEYKQRAKQILENAVKSGKLKRRPCIVCRNSKADGHHPDYSKPLEVIWLCRACHMKEHRKPVDTPFTEAQAIRELEE